MENFFLLFIIFVIDDIAVPVADELAVALILGLSKKTLTPIGSYKGHNMRMASIMTYGFF